MPQLADSSGLDVKPALVRIDSVPGSRRQSRDAAPLRSGEYAIDMNLRVFCRTANITSRANTPTVQSSDREPSAQSASAEQASERSGQRTEQQR